MTVESARAALERKAQLYEKLRKGKSGGLSEQQYDALLVDVSAARTIYVCTDLLRVLVQFDSKDVDRYESDSDDVDESAIVPRAPEHDVSVACSYWRPLV